MHFTTAHVFSKDPCLDCFFLLSFFLFNGKGKAPFLDSRYDFVTGGHEERYKDSDLLTFKNTLQISVCLSIFLKPKKHLHNKLDFVHL